MAKWFIGLIGVALLSTTVDAGLFRCWRPCVRVRVVNHCVQPCEPCQDCSDTSSPVSLEEVPTPVEPTPKATESSSRPVSPAQAWAVREVKIMAQRGRCGHFLGVAPGCSFSGVGYTSNANCPTHLIPSCRPRWRMTLVAEAVVRTPRGCYVSRHWR